MNGIIDPGSPLVMQRSNRLKSSGPLNGPPLKLLTDRGRALTRSRATSYGALRRCASGVSGGILPSGGSTTSHARLPFVTSRLSRNCSGPTPGARSMTCSCRFSRISASSAPDTSSTRRPSNSGGRSNGVLCSYLFVKFPCRSGSPQGVRGTAHVLWRRLRAAGCERLVVPG